MDIENRVVSLKQLLLDPNNLRLDFDLTSPPISEKYFIEKQGDTLEKLENENIDELRESILNNGFIEVDRIVVKEALEITSKQKYYVVIEGNRRTAALKGLYNDSVAGTVKIDRNLEQQFSNINVCCIMSNDPKKISTLSASLMGIRHVSGPKKWQGVQSAKLVHQLKIEKRSYLEIGSLLGISNLDAQRRHEGYLAFLQMKTNYPDKTLSKHYALLLEFLANKVAKTWLRWNGTEFINNNESVILFDHLLPSKGKTRAEIHNPSDARAFNRHLEINEHKALLMAGKKLSFLPDLPKSSKSKLNHINKFNSFIKNITFEDIDPEISDGLREVASNIEKKLEGGNE